MIELPKRIGIDVRDPDWGITTYWKWRREHLTKEGRPKIVYQDVEAARTALAEHNVVSRKEGQIVTFGAYQCRFCLLYHLGSRYTRTYFVNGKPTAARHPANEEEFIELGARALAHMHWQNSRGHKGIGRKAFKKVAERAQHKARTRRG